MTRYENIYLKGNYDESNLSEIKGSLADAAASAGLMDMTNALLNEYIREKGLESEYLEWLQIGKEAFDCGSVTSKETDSSTR